MLTTEHSRRALLPSELEAFPSAKEYPIIRKLNGGNKTIIKHWFLSTHHRNTVVMFWNKQAKAMAKKPSPTGEHMHWSYEVTE